MAVNLSPVGGVAAQFFTNSGAPLTGGKIFTYAAGTTTPQVTYTSSQGNVAWTNPIVLDAAGRVPGSGEIWLTDGLIYKFILKDANDVLIATYDNISGINSNFVAFVNSQEIQTATAGQTVFTLTTMQYQVGTNSLSVFVDGVNQYGPGAQYSYVETDSTTVTFASGLHVGAEVKFTTTQQQGAGAVDASQVTYDPPFTGSVATNVEAKLAQIVSVKDFGAASSATAAVNTTAFNDALASGAKQIIVPNDGGVYLVNNTINIPSGVVLIGQGMPTVKLANNAFPAGGAVFTLTSAVGSVIDGIKIDANLTNNGGSIYGVSGAQCSGVTVKNCRVLDATFGIWFTGGNTLKITGNTVESCSAYGITVKLIDVTADCYNIVITGNECKDITDGTSGPLAEGQGIIVYGATGPTSGDYKNITKVIVNDNICHGNGRQGITLTAVNDFVVDGNNCYDNLDNTDLASGILISEACYNGTVTGNTCTNNYDAGILLDIVPQFTPKDYFSYGQVAVTGNSCRENIRTGIKINSCPFSTISGNQISGRRIGTNTQWGIFLTAGGVNNIVGNNVSYCSENGIRVPGLSVPLALNSQQRVVIADNIITNIVAASSSVYSALYVDYWVDVQIQNNLFSENTQDLTVGANATGVTLLDNRFTSNIYTNASASIDRWDDEFRSTAAASNWFSSEFIGSGMQEVRLEAGFTVPHFGLGWLPVTCVANVTSDLTTAIAPGYFGQKLQLINKSGAYTITIKQGADTENLSNADVVLAFGEMVEYTYTGTLWLQTAAKVATSL